VCVCLALYVYLNRRNVYYGEFNTVTVALVELKCMSLLSYHSARIGLYFQACQTYRMVIPVGLPDSILSDANYTGRLSAETENKN